MTIKSKTILFTIFIIFLMFSFLGLQNKKTLSLNIESFSFIADENEIILIADIGTISDKTYLVRFKPNQYHSSTDFIALYDGAGDDNTNDGYDTDRNYYSLQQQGFIEKEITSSVINIKISRYSSVLSEKGYDKIYDKYYIIKGGNENMGMHSGGTVLKGPLMVTAFPSQRNYENKAASSIKGLEIRNIDDAENLGIKQGAVTFDLAGLLTSSNSADAITFKCNGKNYYFSENYLKSYDNAVMANTEANIKTTFVMIIWRMSVSKAFSEIIHPDNSTSNINSLSIVAPNLTTQAGINYFIAMFEFLADRYTREDMKYGRVSNFVIGNEVDAAYEWNNMGYLPLDEYLRQYERTVRAAYTAIKKYYKNAVILISMTHFWNYSTAAQFGITEYVNKGAYTSKQILDGFTTISKQYGDYLWEVAFHPYRATPMGDPVFWDAYNVSEAPHTENAKKITPLNIDVLGEYLKKDQFKYGDKIRNFYLTESGVASPHDGNNYDSLTYDPQTIPELALKQQAAAYAYTYYSFLFAGAKANIFHRHYDVAGENGINIGLWTRVKGSEMDLYNKKPVWEIVKYIDTERSLEFTEPLLKYITLYPSTECAKSWNDLIPNFDITKLEKTPYPLEEKAQIIQDFNNNFMIADFENNDTNGWMAANCTKNIQIFNSSELANKGSGVLAARYNNSGNQGGGFAEKGIVKYFDIPCDLSEAISFNFAVNVSKLNTDTDYYIKIRFYSEDKILESKTAITPNLYKNISVDIKNSGWDYFNKVDKIKIWFSVDNNTVQAGTILFDDIGFITKKTGGCSGCSSNNINISVLTLLIVVSITLLIKKHN